MTLEDSSMNIEQLKERVCVHFDELSLLDFLDIDMEELVEILTEEIDGQKERFEREVR